MIELQQIDCNCNDCKHLVRDVDKFRSFDNMHGVVKAGRVMYGRCTKLDKDVSFLPNTCMLENQKCFEHRRL